MLYLVKIGQRNRNGDFQEMHNFPVESDSSDSAIRSYYREKYHGFDILIDSINPLLIQKPEIKPENKSYLSDLLVRYAYNEKSIADRIEEKYNEIAALEKELHRLIRERYDKMPIVDASDHHGGIAKLYTYPTGSTRIVKLYLNTNIFIKHLEEGKEIFHGSENN